MLLCKGYKLNQLKLSLSSGRHSLSVANTASLFTKFTSWAVKGSHKLQFLDWPIEADFEMEQKQTPVSFANFPNHGAVCFF